MRAGGTVAGRIRFRRAEWKADESTTPGLEYGHRRYGLGRRGGRTRPARRLLGHRTSHGAACATAPADLLQLAEPGFLDRCLAGKKTNVYHPPPGLEDRIRSLPGDA